MIPVASIVGVLKAGAELAEAVRGFINRNKPAEETAGQLKFDDIADAVGNLVTEGQRLYEESKAVMSSTDAQEVKSALARIQAANDALYQSTSAKLDAASKQ
jgi:hypothetical protein